MNDGSQAVALYVIEDNFIIPPVGNELVLAAPTERLQATGSKAVSGRRFQPGQSGNPAGRPRGSRNKLSELFITAMRDDFAEHGPSAVAALRERDPGAYLAAIRSMIPAQAIAENADKVPVTDYDALSDVEYAAEMDAGGNPYEGAKRLARRNKAMQMVLDGHAASVTEAMRMLGADL